MGGDIFFSGWHPLIRTLVLALLAYPAMLLLLRLSGQRTLSKMNAFDFVVTIALGSTLASVLLTSGVALAQGLLAFFMLIAMQYGLAWLTSRSSAVERLVNGEPVLLFHHGDFLRGAMRRARISEDEIRASARTHGHAALETVAAVVLETNGTLSVVPAAGDEATALRGSFAWPGCEGELRNRR